MGKRRKKVQASDPADITARRVERRAFEARGLTVNIEHGTEKIAGVWRLDCFDRLLKDQPNEREAINWLETLIRTANGENGGERRPDFIRASVEGAPGQNFSQAMIDASEELAAVEDNLYPACVRLLFGLLRPDAALKDNWRAVVQSSTGETNEPAQGAVVRAASANLLWVRQNIHRLTRERKERRRMAA